MFGTDDNALADVVDETFYVTSVEETHEALDAIFAARAQAYGGQADVTQTLIGVNGLFLPDLKLEIRCVAVLSGD